LLDSGHFKAPDQNQYGNQGMRRSAAAPVGVDPLGRPKTTLDAILVTLMQFVDVRPWLNFCAVSAPSST
jgi:hypothetical protein